jgi:hypothetical protein
MINPALALDAQKVTTIKGKKYDLTTYSSLPTHVTNEEAAAAFFYTKEGYKVMNKALRERNSSNINRHAKKILDLSSLINKSRNGKCTFYRFLDNNPALLNQMKTKGQVFIERGFFSTTLDKNPDDDGHFSNKEYIITGTSSRCANIADFSFFEGENEVLFPPGSKFVVTKNMKGKNIYLKEELD